MMDNCNLIDLDSPTLVLFGTSINMGLYVWLNVWKKGWPTHLGTIFFEKLTWSTYVVFILTTTQSSCNMDSKIKLNYLRSFHFQANWTTYEDFDHLVHQAWEASGGSVRNYVQKIKENTIQSNKNGFGNIFTRKAKLEARLCGFQKSIDNHPDHSLWMLNYPMRHLMVNENNKPRVQILQHKYINNSTPLQASYKQSDSFIWKSICKANMMLKDVFSLRLGLGYTSIWNSNWCKLGRLGGLCPYFR
ncbi:hypothetical protein VNO78_08565 [Psophocarpus tetragonolobus]|uniref:Uncharacterized protein n=1 Tax=Psophocarpus tetragonolobus TaxID=3891 RepID=A0AAN9XTI4_PSOTE